MPSSPIERSGEDVAVRADDHGVAARQPVVVAAVELVAAGNVGRDVGAAHAEVHADDEHPALFGDVLHRRHPHVASCPTSARGRRRSPARTARLAPAACSSPSTSIRRGVRRACR